ncbi:hypothetical protein [Paracoccus jeotgali]|uniref:hypothetical protein n=1 Tax=Paracoccus jeotgali TaxID=2065379 RepID=UPI0028A6462D|nr:hypothetical protein [Paracoccus jeotgali]
MELKEFVKATLQSLQDASLELTSAGINVNPATDRTMPGTDVVAYFNGFVPVTSVKFDVAVTESSADKAGGKAGISILPLRAEAGGEVSNATQNASRITFEMRIALPSTKVEGETEEVPTFQRRSIL